MGERHGPDTAPMRFRGPKIKRSLEQPGDVVFGDRHGFCKGYGTFVGDQLLNSDDPESLPCARYVAKDLVMVTRTRLFEQEVENLVHTLKSNGRRVLVIEGLKPTPAELNGFKLLESITPTGGL